MFSTKFFFNTEQNVFNFSLKGEFTKNSTKNNDLWSKRNRFNLESFINERKIPHRE